MKSKRKEYKSKNGNAVGFFKQAMYVIIVLWTVVYIVYRAFYTLPIHLGIVGLICSIAILLLEIWESFDFLIYYFNILSVNKKTQKTPVVEDENLYPDVDVLVATINEGEGIIRNTVEACINMNYPNKSKVHIYVCDDGNRANIKKMAESLGVNYITRLTNQDAKTGNYNHALKHISSPYVATFDADMAPTSEFLMKIMPYFIKEQNVGFVQLPQSFKNPDIYQLRFGLSNKIPFEQDYFYHQIQIAKNETNTAIYEKFYEKVYEKDMSEAV